MTTLPRKYKKTNRLSKLGLDEVSLVPAGDDPMAEVVLSKSDKTPGEPAGVGTFSEQDTTASSKETAVGKKIEIEIADDGTISKDDLPEGLKNYISGLEKENADFAEALEAIADGSLDDEAIAAAVAEFEAEQDDDKVVDAVLAKADPVIREAVAKAEQRAEEAERIAKAERDARVTGQFVEVAKGLPNLATEPQKLGEILKAVADGLTEDQSAEVYRLFAAANEAVGKAAFFDEVGKSGANTTLGSRVEAKVDEIRKADPNVPYEVAVAKAYAEDPSLYDADSKES